MPSWKSFEQLVSLMCPSSGRHAMPEQRIPLWQPLRFGLSDKLSTRRCALPGPDAAFEEAAPAWQPTPLRSIQGLDSCQSGSQLHWAIAGEGTVPYVATHRGRTTQTGSNR